MHELGTVYGLEDMWDLLEIARVNTHNNRVMQKRNKEAEAEF